MGRPPPRPMTRWIAGVVVVAAVAIVAVLLVAGGSGADDESGATVGRLDPERMEALRECLSAHGAKLPEPPTGHRSPAPPGGDTPATPPPGGLELPAPSVGTGRALEACGELMPAPSGVPFGAPVPQD